MQRRHPAAVQKRVPKGHSQLTRLCCCWIIFINGAVNIDRYITLVFLTVNIHFSCSYNVKNARIILQSELFIVLGKPSLKDNISCIIWLQSRFLTITWIVIAKKTKFSSHYRQHILRYLSHTSYAGARVVTDRHTYKQTAITPVRMHAKR